MPKDNSRRPGCHRRWRVYVHAPSSPLIQVQRAVPGSLEPAYARRARQRIKLVPQADRERSAYRSACSAQQAAPVKPLFGVAGRSHRYSRSGDRSCADFRCRSRLRTANAYLQQGAVCFRALSVLRRARGLRGSVGSRLRAPGWLPRTFAIRRSLLRAALVIGRVGAVSRRRKSFATGATRFGRGQPLRQWAPGVGRSAARCSRRSGGGTNRKIMRRAPVE